MKLISVTKWMSPLITGLVLSGCATDYVSQLSEPNFGMAQRVHYSEQNNMDPTMMMNGIYASTQMSTFSSGALCSTDRCSQSAPLWSSGFTP